MRALSLLTLGMALALGTGCGGSKRSVKRVAAGEQIDLSGKWNDTDAKLTSDALIKQCFDAAWLNKFVADSGRQPAVGVARIINKSDEHIDAGVFVKNIERAMVNSGQVEVVVTKIALTVSDVPSGRTGWNTRLDLK